jgi:long-chain acyl-CoA synthetase
MNGSRDLKTIPGYFRQNCGRFPSRPAQRFNANLYQGDNNGRYTYAEMGVAVECIAAGLMSLGMARQDKVALMSHTTPYWTQADMAVASAAGVVVAVSSTLSADEACIVLAHSSCRYLFVDTEENLGKIQSKMNGLPALEAIVVMDISFKSDGGTRVMGIWDLLSRGIGWRKEHMPALEERVQSVQPDDPYTILYTPGTTGRGVILTHRAVSTRLEGMKEFFSRRDMEITHDDVTLCYLPLSGIFERVSCELLALSQGACIAYGDKPATLLQDMQRYNPTWINLMPEISGEIGLTIREKMGVSPLGRQLFDMALHAGRKALDYRRDHRGTYNMHPRYELEARLPWGLKIQYGLADRLFARVRALFGRRFRFALSAAAGTSPDLLMFFYTLGLAVVEGYGSFETAGACIMNPITSCKPGWIGIQACGSEARIAPDGTLEVSGAGIFSGYLGLPGDTKQAITEDGWFRTGDIVKLDDWGYLRMAGS